VSETPSLAWHVVIYSWREYIPVIKCIGYKQNHGAGPDCRLSRLEIRGTAKSQRMVDL
jgi:hypothetical protein